MRPQRATVDKLAAYFGVTTDYLLGTEETIIQPTRQDSQIAALIRLFSACDIEGQFRIIQTAMNEYERCDRKQKKRIVSRHNIIPFPERR